MPLHHAEREEQPDAGPALAMAFKLIEAAQDRWRAVNAPHLVPLVRGRHVRGRHAWTHKDLDRAMTYIAENILCDTPAGRVRGAGAYRAFMAPFMQLLTNATIIAAFGNDQTAMLMYDTKTVPARPVPAAECVTVEHDKITRSWFVVDRALFEGQEH